MTTRYCVDCKHYCSPSLLQWASSIGPFCSHPVALSPVDGSASSECLHMRRMSDCGPDAKLWEAK